MTASTHHISLPVRSPGALNPPKLRGRTVLTLSLAFCLATLLLTRHAQVPGLSSLTAPWALLILLATLSINRVSLAVAPMLMYCCVSLIAASFAGNDPSVGVRFLVITIATLLAFGVRSQRISVGLALFPVVLQAIAIAVLSLTLSILQDPVIADAMRSFAMESEWGDIYSLDGIYYRVQVIGNALLPLLFMICLWSPKSAFKSWGIVISIIGLLAAGNLTYFLMVGLAFVFRFKSFFYSHTKTWLALLMLVIATAPLTSDVGLEAVARKFDGADSSMGIRFDQIDAVARTLDDHPWAMLTGAGLGARFPDGKQRSYSDSLYIELQALYITYQLGIVGAALYLITLMYCARQRLNSAGCVIFGLYVFSGISNPYILDTNQIIATMLLVHLFPRNSSPVPPIKLAAPRCQHMAAAAMSQTIPNSRNAT
jgi:hypothetical protein